MDRALISWNVPNLITVPLMAFGSFVIAGLVWQFVKQMASGGNSGPANNSTGY